MSLYQRPLEPRIYCDPETLVSERGRLFAGCWQLAGHRSQMPQPGGYLVPDTLLSPTVITRSTEGDLHAMSNVCRHRAGPVASGSGQRSRLTCAYHGWTYDLAGQLVLAPEFDLETLPQTCAALPQYEISEAAHFAFVRQTAGVVPLNDYCGEMADELDAYGIAGLKFERRMSYDLACNWKVYVENYLEPYHLPLVHPALHRVTDYDRYAIDCRGWHVRQQGPPRDAKAPTAGWYWLFPNTIVNCSFGLVSTNMVLPVDAGHCRVIADFYVRESADSAVTDEAIAFSDAIQVEDVAICEAVQQGLASGAYAYGVLHPTREIGLMHFAMLYRRMMGQG